MAKTVNKAQGFECPCGDVVPEPDAADHIDCWVAGNFIYQCLECETWYLDDDEAKECCSE